MHSSTEMPLLFRGPGSMVVHLVESKNVKGCHSDGRKWGRRQTPWEQKRQMECYVCHQEREARMRVIPPGAAGEPRAASRFLSQTFGGFFRHSYYDLVVYCMLGYLDCLSFARVPVLSFWVPRVKPKTQPCF